jgi:hypothetical protein
MQTWKICHVGSTHQPQCRPVPSSHCLSRVVCWFVTMRGLIATVEAGRQRPGSVPPLPLEPASPADAPTPSLTGARHACPEVHYHSLFDTVPLCLTFHHHGRASLHHNPTTQCLLAHWYTCPATSPPECPSEFTTVKCPACSVLSSVMSPHLPLVPAVKTLPVPRPVGHAPRCCA